MKYHQQVVAVKISTDTILGDARCLRNNKPITALEQGSEVPFENAATNLYSMSKVQILSSCTDLCEQLL
jgi:hypothetical protein